MSYKIELSENLTLERPKDRDKNTNKAVNNICI